MSELLFLAIIENVNLIPKLKRTARGKYSDKAKRYHNNQNLLAWEFKKVWKDHDAIDYPVGLEVIVNFKDYRIRDADNAIGSILDALKKAGVIKDDHTRIVSMIKGIFFHGKKQDIWVFLRRL